MVNMLNTEGGKAIRKKKKKAQSPNTQRAKDINRLKKSQCKLSKNIRFGMLTSLILVK